MYHSVYFDNMNTFSDWHLVPQGRPLVAMPELKSTVVDIPGANGSLDLTEALTGYPIYQNRSGSILFYVLTPPQEVELGLSPLGNWSERYSDISSFVHGRVRRIRLEDDPDWYYEGRCSLMWTSNNDGSGSEVEISYDVDPYKYSTTLNMTSYEVNTENPLTISFFENGDKCVPIIPEIEVTSLTTDTLVLSFTNLELNIENREDEFGGIASRPLFSFPLSNLSGENIPQVTVTGGGTFTINYRKARL